MSSETSCHRILVSLTVHYTFPCPSVLHRNVLGCLFLSLSSYDPRYFPHESFRESLFGHNVGVNQRWPRHSTEGFRRVPSKGTRRGRDVWSKETKVFVTIWTGRVWTEKWGLVEFVGSFWANSNRQDHGLRTFSCKLVLSTGGTRSNSLILCLSVICLYSNDLNKFLYTPIRWTQYLLL